ncbi:MAG: GntR family transcriptional regulator [Planctomycetota bacterium]
MDQTTKENKKILTHVRISRKLYDKITRGAWSNDEKIPSEAILAKDYSVSRATIRKALKTLEDEGVLRAEQGRGRIVTLGEKNHHGEILNYNTIGIITNNLVDDSYYGEFEEIYAILQGRDYHLNLYTLKDNATPLATYLGNLSKKQISGLLIYCQQILKRDILEFEKYIPTVAVFHRCSDLGIPSFYMAWALASYDASTHLFEQGYAKQMLALVSKPFFIETNNQLTEGYIHAHLKRNIESAGENIVYLRGDPGNDEGRQSILRPVLDKIKESGSQGIIAYSNWVAVELAKCALAEGIRIPDQLGIIALQDTKSLRDSPIGITAFSFDRKKLVRQGVERLLNIIEGESSKDGNDLNYPFYGKLIVRQSTKKADLKQTRNHPQTP